MLEKASSSWCDESSVEEKWSAVKSALISTAEEVLGEASRAQPNWFRESLESLEPQIATRKTATQGGWGQACSKN